MGGTASYEEAAVTGLQQEAHAHVYTTPTHLQRQRCPLFSSDLVGDAEGWMLSGKEEVPSVVGNQKIMVSYSSVHDAQLSQ